ncbi:hypothetical protein EsH8_IX_000261 [Colletotrichum jinshuiense]
MTIAKCAAFCSMYDLFGVEYGRECYCGSSRDPGSMQVDSTDCSFACAGDPNSVDRCGAGDRLNLYSNSNPVVRGPASLPGITSLGCFVDNGQRVLPSKSISANDMTAAKCAANCAGYDYFGTQWSSECYCGSIAPTVPAPASDCDKACSGNDDELCGGSMRLNVYKNAPVSTTPVSSPGQTTDATTPAISGFEYQGCYTDNVPQRVLTGKVVVDPAMTLEKCAASCSANEYAWFGVEYRGECYCGTQLDGASMKVSAAECDLACNGNQSQQCGGANRLNLYMSPTLSGTTRSNQNSLGSFRYKSCWTDNVNDRSLKVVDYRSDDMTVEKCAARCQDYLYFGLEYSRECYCGNEIIGQAAPETECGMICMGADNEWCGGPNRLNLYTQQQSVELSEFGFILLVGTGFEQQHHKQCARRPNFLVILPIGIRIKQQHQYYDNHNFRLSQQQ